MHHNIQCIILASILTITVVFSQTPNICPNAFYTSTNNFIYNNQGCQGFSYNNTLTPNPNFNSISCMGNFFNCWYGIASTNIQITQYLFCNSTLSACMMCVSKGGNPGCVSCTACQSGYYSNLYNATLGCTNCLPCSSNCTYCPNNNTCTLCSSGFFLNLYNTANMYFNCMACSPGCSSCPSAANCTTCYTGYYFYVYNQNQTLQTCQLCNVTFPGCQTCSNNLTCSQCSPGYYAYTYNLLMSYTNCISCNSAIPGCMSCNSQLSCQQCSAEYININGICYKQDGIPVSGIDPFTSGGSKTAEIIMDVFVGFILVAIIYAFCVFFVQKRFTPRPAYVSREPVKIDQTEIQQPKRFSEMREPHEMRHDSDIKEPMSTRNAEQYITGPTIRDELVNDQTDRNIAPN